VAEFERRQERAARTEMIVVVDEVAAAVVADEVVAVAAVVVVADAVAALDCHDVLASVYRRMKASKCSAATSGAETGTHLTAVVAGLNWMPTVNAP
jgi:hypothetical protein